MYGFEVDWYLDDMGVATYYAWQAEDFDNEGIPKPNAMRAAGGTPHEAIANLCVMIDEDDVEDVEE